MSKNCATVWNEARENYNLNENELKLATDIKNHWFLSIQKNPFENEYCYGYKSDRFVDVSFVAMVRYFEKYEGVYLSFAQRDQKDVNKGILVTVRKNKLFSMLDELFKK